MRIFFAVTVADAYRGSMSHPCCMKAPSENQRLLKIEILRLRHCLAGSRLLKMVKLLVTDGPSVLSSMFHSSGLNEATLHALPR